MRPPVTVQLGYLRYITLAFRLQTPVAIRLRSSQISGVRSFSERGEIHVYPNRRWAGASTLGRVAKE
jgi:hypothetical protein